jgi:hypothetical protein
MIAVLFEVHPKAGREAEYLDLGAALRPLVEKIDGFVAVERFRSVKPDGKILSLSLALCLKPRRMPIPAIQIVQWRLALANRRYRAREPVSSQRTI